MNNPITVSAVITTFNRAALVVRAVESVLSQSYPVHEIVVVDDASGDDTEAVIRRMDIAVLRYVRLPKNSGQPVATNVGLDVATSDVIAFLDSDDVWLPGKIEEQVRFYEQSDAPERLVVSSRLLISGGGLPDRVRPHRVINDSERVGGYLFTRDGLLQTSTLMVPTALAKTVRFHPDHRVHTDIGFCLDLQNRGAEFLMSEKILSIWSEDNPDSRASFDSKYEAQENWLANFGHLLSKPEESGFRARLLFPYTAKRSKRQAFMDTYAAWRSQAVTAQFMLSNFLRLILSGKSYWYVRGIIARLRHPLNGRPSA